MTTDILDLTKATVPVGADAIYLATGIVGKTGTDQYILLTDLFDNMVNNKNVIINGDMEISQRGTSFAAIATGAYSLDRYAYRKNGVAVHTITQDADVPTFAESGHTSKHSLKVDCTTIDASIAADDFANIQYRVEGYDYFPLVDRTATLSFMVKATKIGIYCVAFLNSSSDRSYVVEYEVLVTDTWEKKTITLDFDETGGTWDYTTGIGIKIVFSLTAGTTIQTTADVWQNGNYSATSNQVNACDSTDNNFWLSQVKLEIGSKATDFVSRPYAEELALCMRYFQKSYNYATAPGTATTTNMQGGGASAACATVTYLSFLLSWTKMRGTPTIVLYDSAGASAKVDRATLGAGPQTGNVGVRTQHGESSALIYSSSGLSHTHLECHFTLDAEL